MAAMKISTNKSQKAPVAKSERYASDEDTSTKPRYTVEQISNGFILEKSWCDKVGKYHCVKRYHETNPLEDEENDKE